MGTEAGNTDAQNQPGFTAVTEAASAAHSHRPAVIYTMYRDRLTFNDKGEATNVKDVLDQARREVPELFGITGNGNAGAQGGSAPLNANSVMNAEIRRSAGRGSGPF